MQVYYMNLWSSHCDEVYKLVETRMLNVSVSSRKFFGASRLEQKIERLGLVSISQSFGERLVSVSSRRQSEMSRSRLGPGQEDLVYIPAIKYIK